MIVDPYQGCVGSVPARKEGFRSLLFSLGKDFVPFRSGLKNRREREQRGQQALAKYRESPLEFEGPTLKEPYFEALAALFD